MRVKETQRIRKRWAELKTYYSIRMKRTIFEVFIVKKSINNTMAIVMSNLERFMRTKLMGDAYKDVKSYAWSKRLATGVFKRRAAYDIMALLS